MKAALLAVPLALVVLVVAGVVLWSSYKVPMHEDAASVPSRTDAPPADRYTGPVEAARRRARVLVAGDNLPGLSVACLLYTSPSPRDGLLSRMPSSA